MLLQAKQLTTINTTIYVYNKTRLAFPQKKKKQKIRRLCVYFSYYLVCAVLVCVNLIFDDFILPFFLGAKSLTQ